METSSNQVTLCGWIAERPVFSHENHGKKFYRFLLEIPRLSGTCDCLPVIAAEEVLCKCAVEEADRLRVSGSIRTFNSRNESGRKLIISVFADTLSCTGAEEENTVALTGALCKTPILRRTPLGRDICDIMLAVPRKYGRTDYIPCILWGRTAQEAATLPVGSRLELSGRLQSRNYLKVLDDRTEERVAYEVSVMDAYLLNTDESPL